MSEMHTAGQRGFLYYSVNQLSAVLEVDLHRVLFVGCVPLAQLVKIRGVVDYQLVERIGSAQILTDEVHEFRCLESVHSPVLVIRLQTQIFTAGERRIASATSSTSKLARRLV